MTQDSTAKAIRARFMHQQRDASIIDAQLTEIKICYTQSDDIFKIELNLSAGFYNPYVVTMLRLLQRRSNHSFFSERELELTYVAGNKTERLRLPKRTYELVLSRNPRETYCTLQAYFAEVTKEEFNWFIEHPTCE